MESLICNCGFKVEDADHYKVEAKMWKHAIREHLKMLQDMTLQQMENTIKNNDKQMDIK